jgi:hypothetical protein
MQKVFHNSIGLHGEELKKTVANCLRQEDAIFTIYSSTRKRWTPWDIHGMCMRAGHKHPITSTRRAITNLLNRGELTKTSDTKIGEYGKPETFYILNFLRYPSPVLEQPSLFQ